MSPYCSTCCHQKHTGIVKYGLAQVQNSSLSFQTYHGHLLFVQLDSVSTYQAKRKEEEEFFLLLCFTSVGLLGSVCCGFISLPVTLIALMRLIAPVPLLAYVAPLVLPSCGPRSPG